MVIATIGQNAVSRLERLKSGMREWGIGSAPTAVSKYPCLKALEYSWLGAFGSTVLLVPLAIALHMTGSASGSVPLMNFAIGFGIFGLLFNFLEYWICLGVLTVRLKKQNSLDRLSADGLELFSSNFDREFEVPADKQSTLDRILGALQADKYCRLTELDKSAGLIRASKVVGIYRLRDYSFHVTQNESGSTSVRVISTSSCARDKRNGGIPIKSLPETLALEENIKTGLNCANVSKEFFRRPRKFLVTEPLLLWSAALILWSGSLIYFCSDPSANSSISLDKSQDSLVAGDYDEAKALAQKAVDVARKTSRGRSDKGDLGRALLNAAQVALVPLEFDTIDTGSIPAGSNSGANSVLNKAEAFLREAVAVDPKWSLPVAEMAILQALKGDMKAANASILQAEELLATDEAELGSTSCDTERLNYARGFVYHAQGDNVAAALYLKQNSGYQSSAMQASKLSLALFTKLAKDRPNLKGEVDALQTAYNENKAWYDGTHNTKPSDLPLAIAVYLLLFAAPPVVMSAMLKDNRRSAETAPNVEPSSSELAEIEEGLDEEAFWQNFMRDAERVRGESEEQSTGVTIKLPEGVGAVSESA